MRAEGRWASGRAGRLRAGRSRVTEGTDERGGVSVAIQRLH